MEEILLIYSNIFFTTYLKKIVQPEKVKSSIYEVFKKRKNLHSEVLYFSWW